MDRITATQSDGGGAPYPHVDDRYSPRSDHRGLPSPSLSRLPEDLPHKESALDERPPMGFIVDSSFDLGTPVSRISIISTTHGSSGAIDLIADDIVRIVVIDRSHIVPAINAGDASIMLLRDAGIRQIVSFVNSKDGSAALDTSMCCPRLLGGLQRLGSDVQRQSPLRSRIAHDEQQAALEAGLCYAPMAIASSHNAKAIPGFDKDLLIGFPALVSPLSSCSCQRD